MFDKLEIANILEPGDTMVIDGQLYLKAQMIEAAVLGAVMAYDIYPQKLTSEYVLHYMVDILETMRAGYVDEENEKPD